MDPMEARLTQLETIVAEQQQLIAAQREELRRLAPQAGPVAPVGDATGPSSDGHDRRTMFKVAATAAAAAVAAPLVASPAHAANGDPLRMGQVNTATDDTVVNATGNGLFSGQNILTVTDDLDSSSFPAAVGAYAQGDRVTNGLYAFANTRDDADTSTGHAIIARPTSGGRSHLLFRPVGSDPRDDDYEHTRGELRATGSDLWYCVETGAPGTWRKITGPSTSGAVHAIAPQRVYDSRFDDGPLTAGFNRTVPVIDGIDADTGEVAVPGVVPPGATAVMFNVTVTETEGLGFVGVAPGDATDVQASTVNWSEAGSTQANASLSTLDDMRALRVFCGGTGSTQFIIDITAYLL